MRRSIFVVAAAIGALAVPATASADTYNGTDCTYTNDEQVSQDVGPATVYADADGGGGMTGTAAVSGGACANGLALGGIDGGTLEAGVGGTSGYAILDGDNNNTDPSNQSDGYFGLSNYETGAKGSCDTPPGTGTNSGGCIGIDGVGEFDVPVPLACGNTSGPTYNNTGRDGCSIP